MLTTGMLSITFRKLSAQRVIELTTTAGLSSIEWGGDIHVPHGDIDTGKHVQQLTQDAGLSISAYGSYYRLAEGKSSDFEAVLDTAEALGTSVIRVWAGAKGSIQADESYRQQVVENAQRIAELSQSRQIQIALEYHGNTLTDTLESTQQLLKAVNHDNLKTFWQPPHTHDLVRKQHELQSVLSDIVNVHVFYWNPDNTKDRRALVEGASDWASYIEILKTSKNDHVLSLEFVRDDDIAQFLRDAETLKSWLT